MRSLHNDDRNKLNIRNINKEKIVVADGKQNKQGRAGVDEKYLGLSGSSVASNSGRADAVLVDIDADLVCPLPVLVPSVLP